MTLEAYNQPSLPAFRSPSFARSTARWREQLLQRVPPERRGNAMRPWAFPGQGGAHQALPAQWHPKLYVCVGAQQFWPTVHRLMDTFASTGVHWKFYSGTEACDRPDKIVFFGSSSADLRRTIVRIRSVLPTRGLHRISHAAPASALRLEDEGNEGIYAGSDPWFLPQSWRMYRLLCVAFAEANHGYFSARPGGKQQWLKRMNISSTHAGPVVLVPRRTDTRFIRRWWRVISEP